MANYEDLEIGRPLEPLVRKTGNDSAALFVNDEYSAAGLGMGGGLLSPGMLKAAEAADALGIQRVDDVVFIFEGFKWMSWINICLHALRQPLPTRAIRLLVESAQPLHLADEKIVKALTTVYLRSRFSSIICFSFLRNKFDLVFLIVYF